MDIKLNDGKTAAMFSSENFLWEPGRSQKASAKISNEGSLWLKYNVVISNVKTEDTVAPAADITKVLDVYKIDGAEVTSSDLIESNKLGTMSELMSNDGSLNAGGYLAPSGYSGLDGSDNASFTIVVKMQEGAGNDYQGASASFDIVVKATQYTYEKDGFGNSSYDEGAALNFGVASDADGLLSAAKAITGSGTIYLSKDIIMSPASEEEVLNVKSGQNITVNFEGNEIALPSDGERYNRPINMSEGGNAVLTLKNGVLDSAGGGTTKDDGTGAYGTVYMEMSGTLNMENMVLKNARPWGLNVKVGFGSTANIKDTTVVSKYGGGIEVSMGTAVLDNCTFTQEGYYDWCSTCVSASSGGILTVNSGTYTSENYCVYVFNSGADITVNGGTFRGDKAVLKADAGTITVNGGDFTGPISIASNANMIISSGTFSNTGLTLDQFHSYVAQGHSVTETDGVFIVE